MDAKLAGGPSSSIKVSDGESSLVLLERKDNKKQNTGSNQSKTQGNKLKTVAGASDLSHQRYDEKGSVSGKPLNVVDEQKLSARGNVGIPGDKHPLQMVSDPQTKWYLYFILLTFSA